MSTRTHQLETRSCARCRATFSVRTSSKQTICESCCDLDAALDADLLSEQIYEDQYAGSADVEFMRDRQQGLI